MTDRINISDKEIDIVELEFPVNIRTRSGMYIGSTDNPNVILREIIDNAVDESFGSSTCDQIYIVTNVDMNVSPNQYYLIADNGRGIPIILDEDKGITKTKLAMTVLNAGSKFNRTLDTVSTGQNGVGSSCCVALSEEYVICSKVTEANFDKSIPKVKTTWNKKAPEDELFYVLAFKKGIEYKETAMTYVEIKEKWKLDFPEHMSTVVFFRPDPEIFASTKAVYKAWNLMYLQAVHKLFYGKDVKVIIDNKQPSVDFTPYKFEFMKRIEVPTHYDDETGNTIYKKAQFYVNFECSTDLSIQELTGSVNSLVVDRGLHLNYVRNAYRNALKRYYNIIHEQLLAGMKINVICLAGEVDFSSQTKENCVKIDGLTEGEVRPILENEFKRIFKENNEYFLDHVERLNAYADSLNKISTINKIKSMVVVASDAGTKTRSKLPSSVKDCSSNDRKNCELYIVEGKSAGGTILKSRDNRYQAVMELRGVPMNSVNADLDQLLQNEEMTSIISAIGVGVNEYFVEDAIRYGKIIIAADADPDGERIASLILGFFAKKITDLIRLGHVYVLDSPLYRQGDKYIYPTEDINSLLDRSKPFKRFKGLGEINVDESKQVLTGPNRRLIQINLDNVDIALDLLTSSYWRKQLMMQKQIITDKYNIGIV